MSKRKNFFKAIIFACKHQIKVFQEILCLFHRWNRRMKSEIFIFLCTWCGNININIHIYETSSSLQIIFYVYTQRNSSISFSKILYLMLLPPLITIRVKPSMQCNYKVSMVTKNKNLDWLPLKSNHDSWWPF